MDSQDIALLYRQHIAMVRGRGLRLLGNAAAAQDVAQEAFVRFHEHRTRGGTEQSAAAFLYRTVTNLALNVLRDTRRRRELLERQSPVDEQAPGSVEDRLALRAVLGRVCRKDAEIAAYYFVDGLEQEEIASLLGLERRTVGRRLERFRDRARVMLDEGMSHV